MAVLRAEIEIKHLGSQCLLAFLRHLLSCVGGHQASREADNLACARHRRRAHAVIALAARGGRH